MVATHHPSPSKRAGMQAPCNKPARASPRTRASASPAACSPACGADWVAARVWGWGTGTLCPNCKDCLHGLFKLLASAQFLDGAHRRRSDFSQHLAFRPNTRHIRALPLLPSAPLPRTTIPPPIKPPPPPAPRARTSR